MGAQTARVAFITAVTAWLLAAMFWGGAGTSEIVVYSLTAAFGLDFLISSWPSLWGPRDAERVR